MEEKEIESIVKEKYPLFKTQKEFQNSTILF
jgi:hypothetical protein